MESVVFRSFTVLFGAIRILIISGFLVSVLTDLQGRALDSTRKGLVSMRKVNQQLVGSSQ